MGGRHRISELKEQATISFPPKVDKEADKILRWMVWVILEYSEFSFVEKPLVRKGESVTMTEVPLFDAHTLRFHSISKYLSERADIIENPQFEAAVVKSFTTPYEDMKLTKKVHLGRFRTQCESISPASQTDKGNIICREVFLVPEPIPACKTTINLNSVPPTSTLWRDDSAKPKLSQPHCVTESFQIHFEENLPAVKKVSER